MDSLPDYEIRAVEADRLAEAAKNVALAQEWRDIAEGYRLLAGLVASAARGRARPTARRSVFPPRAGASRRRCEIRPPGGFDQAGLHAAWVWCNPDIRLT